MRRQSQYFEKSLFRFQSICWEHIEQWIYVGKEKPSVRHDNKTHRVNVFLKVWTAWKYGVFQRTDPVFWTLYHPRLSSTIMMQDRRESRKKMTSILFSPSSSLLWFHSRCVSLPLLLLSLSLSHPFLCKEEEGSLVVVFWELLPRNWIFSFLCVVFFRRGALVCFRENMIDLSRHSSKNSLLIRPESKRETLFYSRKKYEVFISPDFPCDQMMFWKFNPPLIFLLCSSSLYFSDSRETKTCSLWLSWQERKRQLTKSKLQSSLFNVYFVLILFWSLDLVRLKDHHREDALLLERSNLWNICESEKCVWLLFKNVSVVVVMTRYSSLLLCDWKPSLEEVNHLKLWTVELSSLLSSLCSLMELQSQLRLLVSLSIHHFQTISLSASSSPEAESSVSSSQIHSFL